MPDWPLSSLYLYLTGYCNLNCRHCWINPEYVRTEKIKNYLELAVLKKTLTEAKKIGLKSVKLSGGEPFLYPQILELMKWLKDNSLGITIETNGTLIGVEQARVMKESGVLQVAVALDGPKAEIHEDLRGVKGSFERTVSGIKRIVEQEINLQVIFSLYRKNIKDLGNTIAFAKKMGARSFKINPINMAGRGGEMKKANELLSLEEILDLKKYIFELRKKLEFKIVLDIPMAFWPVSELKNNMGHCGIKNIAGILGDGSVSICGIASTVKELVLGNIKKDSIIDIWHENSVLKQIRKELPKKLEGICGKCIFKNYCLGKCRAEAYLYEKSFFSPLRFCQEAYRKGLFPESRINNNKIGNKIAK